MNIRYFTGFTGENAALVVCGTETVLLVDGRFITQAAREAPDLSRVVFKDLMTGLASVVSGRGLRAVGFEAARVTVEQHRKLLERLPDVRWMALPDEGIGQRLVKDGKEMACIRRAARISSAALAALRERIRPGVCERDLALELDYGMRRGGAEGPAFPTIVAFGENASLPHAVPGNRALREGDGIVIDCGAVADGYCSDETVTWFFQTCDEELARAYRAVKDAHDRAIAACRAGIACRAVDEAARAVLAEAGLADAFTHGTGHGVGLDVHEPPRLNASSPVVLEAGMVVTVEPGVYLPERFGIRIEDLVHVGPEGAEILSGVSKEWTVVG